MPILERKSSRVVHIPMSIQREYKVKYNRNRLYGYINPEKFREFKLVKRTQRSHNVAKFIFALHEPTSMLALPIGQHISLPETCSNYNDDKTSHTISSKKEKWFAIFEDNLTIIEQHNSTSDPCYKLGLNEFSDLAYEEFKSMYLCGVSSMVSPSDVLIDDDDDDEAECVGSRDSLPNLVDWRERGGIAPVKHQGNSVHEHVSR
ncbi:hypothetical protein L1987_44385 [Smallanthus sonchifolius]|uniref:Uncharacterized protein n=1 Tax=Smallanthus sonchifolius TaxID=185202 RepID=A0ACB9GPA2_9ASTR|nr:hypothetical protein L1987_44385 [Smallanthus sonchifolius]